MMNTSHLVARETKSRFLKYTPSNGLTTIGVLVFLAIAIALTILHMKQKAKYMLALIIGAYFYSVGVAIRYPLHSNPDSLGTYIISSMLIVLTPAFFIASTYSLLSQMATRVNATQYLLLPARRITLIFVLSDVFTFFVQSSGGGLQAMQDADKAKLGRNIMLFGLVAQLLSFAFFTLVFVLWALRVRSRSPTTWATDDYKGWMFDWRTLVGVVAMNCILILVRTFYRVIEYAEGLDGALASHEWCYYMFDALPLAIAIGLFIPFWPERMLPALGSHGALPLNKNMYSEAGQSRADLMR